MKKEFKLIFTAIMFYSRIPVPQSTGYSDEQMNKSTRYFPLVGIIIGGIGAVLFWSANHLFSQMLSILVAMIGMIFISGTPLAKSVPLAYTTFELGCSLFWIPFSTVIGLLGMPL